MQRFASVILLVVSATACGGRSPSAPSSSLNFQGQFDGTYVVNSCVETGAFFSGLCTAWGLNVGAQGTRESAGTSYGSSSFGGAGGGDINGIPSTWLVNVNVSGTPQTATVSDRVGFRNPLNCTVTWTATGLAKR